MAFDIYLVRKKNERRKDDELIKKSPSKYNSYKTSSYDVVISLGVWMVDITICHTDLHFIDKETISYELYILEVHPRSIGNWIYKEYNFIPRDFSAAFLQCH